MRESETNGFLSHGVPISPRGLFAECSSFLLSLRGKLLSFRRKQILIMLAMFTVAIVVLQMPGEPFVHDSKTGSLNAPPSARTDSNEGIALHRPPTTANNTLASSTDNNIKRNKDGIPSGGTTRADPMGNESMGDDSQSRSVQNDANAPFHNEHDKFLQSRDYDEDHTSSVAKHTEQAGVDEADQGKTQQLSGTINSEEQRAPITTKRNHEISVEADRNSSTANEYNDDNTTEQDATDEAAGDKDEGGDPVTIADGDSTLDRPDTANNKPSETMDSSKHDVSRNKTNPVSIGPTNGVIRNLRTNQLVKEIGYTRTKCYSVSGKPQNHTCAPSVVVAGYEKCGTSALYFKLSLHPEVVAHPKWKEICSAEDSLREMWSWFESLPVLSDSDSNSLLLNGCIGMVSRPVILKELHRLNPSLKVLVALRNYADWSYSFYGYRCYPGYDKGCEKLDKPYSYGPWKETRTPENFAKLVNEIQTAGKSAYEIFEVIQPNAYLFRPWLEELLDIVGLKAVKIIRQEDLSNKPRETLANVARFLEIDSEQFPDEAFTLVSNTHDHPAEVSSVNATATKADISNLMNSGASIPYETRSLLNKFWKSECEWLRDNFEVHFSEAC